MIHLGPLLSVLIHSSNFNNVVGSDPASAFGNVGPAVGLDLSSVVADRTVRPERPNRYTNLKIISKCSDSLQLQLLAHFRMTWMKSLLLLLLLSPLISTSAPYDPQER